MAGIAAGYLMMCAAGFSPSVEMAVTPATSARGVSTQRHERLFSRARAVGHSAFVAGKRRCIRFPVTESSLHIFSPLPFRRNPFSHAIQIP
jgi:hypothetical protein